MLWVIYIYFTHAEKLRRWQAASASLPIVSQPDAEARGFVEAAFEQLAKEVEKNVIDGSDEVKLITLRERFIELHQQLDEGSELVYWNDMLQKRLMARFDSTIEFWHLQELKQVVEAQEEQSRIAHQENNDLPCMLFLCAKHLRSQIKSMRDTLPWPPAPGDLTEEKVRIPLICSIC